MIMPALRAPSGPIRIVHADQAWNAMWRQIGDRVIVDSAYGSLSAPVRRREPKTVAKDLLEKLVTGWQSRNGGDDGAHRAP
jgi:hypothetical protein